MNQDQVKEKLKTLYPDAKPFTVIFSGKTSRKVNGLYHPESCEIIIHNRNFNGDNSLMYTAIHEFAHHIHITTSPLPVGSRSHTTKFYSIFHHLLGEAEKLSIYHNIFETEEAFIELTKRIKEEFITRNGRLIREFGKVLMEAQRLCHQYEASFHDYLDRVLQMPRNSARAMIKMEAMDINPEVGYDNMKILTGIKELEVRKQAEEAFSQGSSPDMVKQAYASRPQIEDELEALESEKVSIERRINTLVEKLKVVEKRIRDAEFRSLRPQDM